LAESDNDENRLELPVSRDLPVERPVALNPRHRGGYEYVGETYLIKGDLKSAPKHLAALREICSLPCEELTDLDREIARYVKKPAANRSR
jgi:hypothetical protein